MKNIFVIKMAMAFLLAIAFISPLTTQGAPKTETGISILENNCTISAPEGSQYRWSYNGKVIANANDQNLAPQKSGTYTVQYADASGQAATTQISVMVSEEGNIIRIFTIGDSTVQDYNDGWYPRKGWGQVLPLFFDPAAVSIRNEAKGGTSAKSYYNDFWPGVRNQLQAGDYVFIQFGINDRAKDDRGSTGDEFKGYLKNFVEDAKAKGAFPVLVSTVRRNAWEADGVTSYDAYHEHPRLVRETATELKVPLIDLDTKSKALMEELGPAYVGRYFYNNYVAGEYPFYENGNKDDVHFQEMGAIEMAKIVVEEIKKMENDENISKLIPHIKPQYEVKISPNKLDAGIITRTTTYPAGLTVTIKALPANGHTFLKWKDAEGNEISDQNLYMFTMGSEDKYFIGYFDDEQGEFDCSGEMAGTASLDNCGVCTGGNTGLDPCSGVIQAEDACINEGSTVESQDENFLGTGYVNSSNETGTALTWFMGGVTEEDFVLNFRYANAASDSLETLLLLNDVEVGEISFPPTASPTEWNTVQYSMSLKKGWNSLQLVGLSDAGIPNLDLFSWSAAHIQKASGECPTTITALDKLDSSAELKVYPNPALDKLNLESKVPFEYKVFDLQGKLLISGSCLAGCQINTPSNKGIYQLLVTTKKGAYSTKFVKR